MINLIFLFIHVYFCFNFITYANRYIIAFILTKINSTLSSMPASIIDKRKRDALLHLSSVRPQGLEPWTH